MCLAEVVCLWRGIGVVSSDEAAVRRNAGFAGVLLQLGPRPCGRAYLII